MTEGMLFFKKLMLIEEKLQRFTILAQIYIVVYGEISLGLPNQRICS